MEIPIIAVVVAVAFVWWALTRSRRNTAALLAFGGATDFYSLLGQGVPARGILLKVGSQRSAQGTASQGFYEVRTVTIDVEIPGKSPYQRDNCALWVPANLCRLVLPGATVELRVDPSSNNIAVFGPGVGLSATGFQ